LVEQVTSGSIERDVRNATTQARTQQKINLSSLKEKRVEIRDQFTIEMRKIVRNLKIKYEDLGIKFYGSATREGLRNSTIKNEKHKQGYHTAISELKNNYAKTLGLGIYTGFQLYQTLYPDNKIDNALYETMNKLSSSINLYIILFIVNMALQKFRKQAGSYSEILVGIMVLFIVIVGYIELRMGVMPILQGQNSDPNVAENVQPIVNHSASVNNNVSDSTLDQVYKYFGYSSSSNTENPNNSNSSTTTSSYWFYENSIYDVVFSQISSMMKNAGSSLWSFTESTHKSTRDFVVKNSDTYVQMVLMSNTAYHFNMIIGMHRKLGEINNGVKLVVNKLRDDHTFKFLELMKKEENRDEPPGGKKLNHAINKLHKVVNAEITLQNNAVLTAATEQNVFLQARLANQDAARQRDQAAQAQQTRPPTLEEQTEERIFRIMDARNREEYLHAIDDDTERARFAEMGEAIYADETLERLQAPTNVPTSTPIQRTINSNNRNNSNSERNKELVPVS